MGKRKKSKLWIICGAICVIGCIYMMGNDKWKEEYPEVISNIGKSVVSGNDDANNVKDKKEWKLLLVNREHYIPEIIR